MTVVMDVALVALSLAGLACVVRVVRCPSLADRALALDTLLVVIIVGVALQAARTGEGTYLDVLLVVALVAFIGTTAVARFIERRGAR